MSDQPPGGKGKLFDAKNRWYWIGGGVGALVLIYYFRKRGQAASAASAGSTVDTTGTSGTDSSSLYDTSGNYDYGSYGGGAYGTTPSLYGYLDPSTGQYITGTGATVVTAPSTNASWAQTAGAYLVSQGYSSTAVGTALGAYLLGVGLTNDQYQIVQAAIAYEGNPPVAVPPPHVNAPAGQGPAGTPIHATFIRNIADGNVWHVDDTQKLRWHVGQPTINKLKAANELPTIQDVLPTDARLRYKYSGVE